MVSKYELNTPPPKKPNWLYPNFKTPEDLKEDYDRLEEQLGLLAEGREGDDFWVKDEVYKVASLFAKTAQSEGRIAPKLFTHGPDSVVFNWTDGERETYATISADKVSLLLSGPDGITHRSTFPLRGEVS